MWNITSNICGIEEGVWQGVTPFQGWLTNVAFFPRAMPWVLMCLPFRQSRALYRKRGATIVMPFQGLLVGPTLPRAMPWAIICHPFRVMGNFELLEYYSYVTFLGFLLPIKPDMSHLVTCISKPTYHL